MIHQYKSNGYAIVLDVNSGSVHVVDDIVYDCIALLDKGCSNEEVTEKLSASYSGEDLKLSLIHICRSGYDDVRKKYIFQKFLVQRTDHTGICIVSQWNDVLPAEKD